MLRYIIRGRKFWLSLSGRENGGGRERKLYWMAGRSLHRQRRTWWGLQIIDPKRLESALPPWPCPWRRGRRPAGSHPFQRVAQNSPNDSCKKNSRSVQFST